MLNPLSRRGTVAQLLAAAAATGGAAGAVVGRSSPRCPAQEPDAVLLQGPGIDPSGQHDSLTAVQALIDAAPAGATIVNPSGVVLRLDGGLTVRRPRTRLTGSGEWRFRSGGTYSDGPDGQIGFIDIRADHCWIDGIHATNPDGVISRGLMFIADFGRVSDCTLIGFGSGIHVAPSGEFHDFTISGNHVLDVIGRGGGPGDRSAAGEDYGDGITCWGSSVTINGNVVTCREGADARIGIHVEALTELVRTSWVHADALATITGNVVHGRFRRGVVSEKVDHVAITGNVVADSTWWGIGLISADHCVVSGNTVVYTRTARDTQGSAWAPSRSAVMLYRVGSDRLAAPVVVDNTILISEEAEAEAGIRITGDDEQEVAVEGGRIAGNRITAKGSLQHGVLADRPLVDLEVDDNRATGWTQGGVTLGDHDGAAIRRNVLRGPGRSSAAVGVGIGAGRRLVCDGNRIDQAATGIRATEQATWTVVRANLLEGLDQGVDLTGLVGQVDGSGNVFEGVDTAWAGVANDTIEGSRR